MNGPQEQRVEQEESLVIKQLKKLIPVSFVSEPVESKTLHPERQQTIEKALKTMQQKYQQSQSSEASLVGVSLKFHMTLEGGRRPLAYGWYFFSFKILQKFSKSNFLIF